MRKIKILIAEDETIVAYDMKERLQDIGYVVSAIVASGEQALEKLSEFHTDLVLMDIGLKGELDGIEAADEIRTRFDIPIVFISALGDKETLQRAKATEPYGYIIKPFDESELFSTIEMALYRHDLEIKLRESEEKYRSLTETTNDWVWEVDENAVYTYASQKVKNLLGYEPDEIIGMTPFDLMPPDEAKRIGMEFGIISEAKRSFDRLENVCFHKNGNRVVLETSGVPLIDDNGNLLGYSGVDRDITERKRTEEKLKWELEVNKAIAQLSEALIAPNSTIEKIANVVLGHAKQLTKSEHGYVSSINPVTGDNVGHTLTKMMGNACLISGKQKRITFPLGQDGKYANLWGHALNTL